MSENERSAMNSLSEGASKLADAGLESLALAVASGYWAGKEAGLRERKANEWVKAAREADRESA